MNDNETVDDVLADMLLPRFDAITAMRANNYDEIKSLIANYRDRIEAAHKRERGDAAKLREALKTVKRYLDGYTINVLEMRRQVDAALAAPPRNCDRFASAEEAWDAYDEWVESYRAKGEIPPFNEFGWLFATATKKEGGAK